MISSGSSSVRDLRRVGPDPGADRSRLHLPGPDPGADQICLHLAGADLRLGDLVTEVRRPIEEGTVWMLRAVAGLDGWSLVRVRPCGRAIGRSHQVAELARPAARCESDRPERRAARTGPCDRTGVPPAPESPTDPAATGSHQSHQRISRLPGRTREKRIDERPYRADPDRPGRQGHGGSAPPTPS